MCRRGGPAVFLLFDSGFIDPVSPSPCDMFRLSIPPISHNRKTAQLFQSWAVRLVEGLGHRLLSLLG